MKRQKIAIENYKKIRNMDGSDFIASEFALKTLLRIVKFFKVKSILEVGLGIGSVSDTILKYVNSRKLSIVYNGTENNDFCLKVLPENVTFFSQINVFDNLNSLPNNKYDLIIIDGSDESLLSLKEICNENTIVFIEGGRQEQTKMVLSIFPNALYVNVITLKKNPFYAHENRSIKNYIGGGQLLFINPTFKMKIFWLNEKVLTFVKIQVRKFKSKISTN